MFNDRQLRNSFDLFELLLASEIYRNIRYLYVEFEK